jgi:hypothetical protein
MPIVVTSGTGQPQASGARSAPVFVPELVPRNCKLKTYKKKTVPSFSISGDVIAYASPDSTFADDAITMVQSGNYSDHSIPLNVVDGGEKNSFKTGNRDMGLVIRSKPLAKFFTKIFNADVKLELTGAQALAWTPRADTFLIEAAPKKMPSTLFPSKTVKLTSPMAVQPILSPDNYMTIVPGLLAQAKKSILIQQQYIKATQTHIVTLLKASSCA